MIIHLCIYIYAPLYKLISKVMACTLASRALQFYTDYMSVCKYIEFKSEDFAEMSGSMRDV